VPLRGHPASFADYETADRLRAAGRRGDLAVVASIGGELLHAMTRDLARE
jgi:hypothetical protein